jgi:hypothetical protein
MERVPGTYALVGVVARPTTNALARTVLPTQYDSTGKLFAAVVWRCETCGAVELVDEGD